MDAVVHSVPLARLVALGPDPLEPDRPDRAVLELLAPPPPDDPDGAPLPERLVVVPAAAVVAAPGATWPVPVGSLLRLAYAANADQAAALGGAVAVRVLPPPPAAPDGG